MNGDSYGSRGKLLYKLSLQVLTQLIMWQTQRDPEATMYES